MKTSIKTRKRTKGLRVGDDEVMVNHKAVGITLY